MKDKWRNMMKAGATPPPPDAAIHELRGRAVPRGAQPPQAQPRPRRELLRPLRTDTFLYVGHPLTTSQRFAQSDSDADVEPESESDYDMPMPELADEEPAAQPLRCSTGDATRAGARICAPVMQDAGTNTVPDFAIEPAAPRQRRDVPLSGVTMAALQEAVVSIVEAYVTPVHEAAQDVTHELGALKRHLDELFGRDASQGEEPREKRRRV